MNDKVIIYSGHDGVARIVNPTGELPIEEVCRKDVPAGVDYWIVNFSDIPTDREFRNAWEVDTNALGTSDGKGIGAEAWFAEQEALNDNS